MMQGKYRSSERESSVGPWGSSSGRKWSYRAKVGIKQIIISHSTKGGFIQSIMFKDDSVGANSHSDYSSKFGGDGGDKIDKVDVDFPSEFLTGISGTLGFHGCERVLTSLELHTNRTRYGPFGEASYDPFSFNSQSSVITGFHGVEFSYLGSIGVYLEPVSLISRMVVMRQLLSVVYRNPDLVPRSPGPWGSVHGGREWDDGVFSAVKFVTVYLRFDRLVITGVQFGYEKRDGTAFLSAAHGSSDSTNEFEIDGNSDEFLIGVQGFHGPVDGVDVIRSITFLTNKGKFGPMGDEIGTYFSSMSSLSSCGKVVGFHGRSGAYLNAIGVHTEYF